MEQYKMLVENLVNDVAYPFKETMNEYSAKSIEMFRQMKVDISDLLILLDKFSKQKWSYDDSSKDFVKSLYSYISFKKESTEASSTFYKNRLFNAMGNKLIVSEEKAYECK